MFIDKFIAFNFNCFYCSLDTIEKYLSNKMSDGKYELSKKEFKFDLYETTPPKGGAHFSKSYFFHPTNNKNIVVMVSNNADGWATLVNIISTDLKLTSFSFQISQTDLSNAKNAFTCWIDGKEARTVYAMKDPRWVFYEIGEKQWFEDESNYSKKIIKNRLNKEIIVSYCRKIGINITDDQFWRSSASLYLERTKW